MCAQPARLRSRRQSVSRQDRPRHLSAVPAFRRQGQQPDMVGFQLPSTDNGLPPGTGRRLQMPRCGHWFVHLHLPELQRGTRDRLFDCPAVSAAVVAVSIGPPAKSEPRVDGSGQEKCLPSGRRVPIHPMIFTLPDPVPSVLDRQHRCDFFGRKGIGASVWTDAPARGAAGADMIHSWRRDNARPAARSRLNHSQRWPCRCIGVGPVSTPGRDCCRREQPQQRSWMGRTQRVPRPL